VICNGIFHLFSEEKKLNNKQSLLQEELEELEIAHYLYQQDVVIEDSVGPNP